MDEDKNKLKTKIRTLKKIALEIGREAELQSTSLDTNYHSMTNLSNAVKSGIAKIGYSIEQKFNIFMYMLFSSLFFFVLMYFLL